jgi:hypothetical protein
MVVVGATPFERRELPVPGESGPTLLRDYPSTNSEPGRCAGRCCLGDERRLRFFGDGNHAITHISAGSESSRARHTKADLLRSGPIKTDRAKADGRGHSE